jgi:hypothetical protein
MLADLAGKGKIAVRAGVLSGRPAGNIEKSFCSNDLSGYFFSVFAKSIL